MHAPLVPTTSTSQGTKSNGQIVEVTALQDNLIAIEEPRSRLAMSTFKLDRLNCSGAAQ